MSKPGAIAQALRLLADAIELDEARVVMPAPSGALLTEKQMLEEYGMGKAAADARGIPRARVGRSYKWKRTDIEVSIQTAPPKPRPKKCTAEGSGSVVDRMLASGQLRKGAR